MANKITESQIEKYAIDLLEKQGFQYIIPEVWELERGDLSNVVLHGRLINAVAKINPGIPFEIIEEAIKQLFRISSAILLCLKNLKKKIKKPGKLLLEL